MAYKTEPGLHIYDDVCSQSRHILCSGTMSVLKNSFDLQYVCVGYMCLYIHILLMLPLLLRLQERLQSIVMSTSMSMSTSVSARLSL